VVAAERLSVQNLVQAAAGFGLPRLQRIGRFEWSYLPELDSVGLYWQTDRSDPKMWRIRLVLEALYKVMICLKGPVVVKREYQ